MGRNEQSVAEGRRVQQADPLSGFAAFSVGAAFVFARQWDPAIAQLHRAIEVDPTFGSVIVSWAGLMSRKESCQRPLSSFSALSNWNRTMPRLGQALDMPTPCRGRGPKRKRFWIILKEVSAHTWVAPYNIAVIYAGLGDKDRAFALLA